MVNPDYNNAFWVFMHNPHVFGHYLGYEDLIPVHSEWIRKAWINNKVDNLQAHRNSFKTTSIIIVGFLWYVLFFNPEVTCLIIRKADSEAKKILETIKDHLESPNLLYLAKEIYGIQSFKTSRWNTSSLKLAIKKNKTPEGSIDAIGMGGAIVGSHYDKIFPDDIITDRDRTSKAEREKTKNFIRELRNIKKEGGDIFFSGTPWHPEDGWTIISEDPLQYPIGTVPIKGYTKDNLEAKKEELKKGTTLSLYDANYELKHTSDADKIFGDPQYGDVPLSSAIAYVDPSYSGDNTTAMSIGYKKDGKAHVRGFVWPDSIEALYDKIAKLANKYKCTKIVVEKNADKGLSCTELRKRFPNVWPKHEPENKHMRIVAFVKGNFDRITFANDVDNNYMLQLVDYQEGEEPDDVADSLAGLMRELGFSTPTSGSSKHTGVRCE